MAGFFYTQNKQKRGPVSSAELKQLASSGKLQPSDQVMKEGSNKWVLAKSVKGLFPGQRPAEPAPQPMAPPPAPLPESPEPLSGGSRWKLWLFLLVVLGGLGAGGYMFMGTGDGGGDGKSTDQGGGGGNKQAKKEGGGTTKGDPAETVDDDAGSPENAKKKMDAWKAFVDAFTTPLKEEDDKTAHMEKCEKLLEAYLKVPFDPLKFKDDAREITRTYKRKNLQAQYPGWEPRKKLDASIQTMMNELERGGT